MGLLRAGADGGTGWKGCNGRTLLGVAAEGGDEEVVSTLLDAGSAAGLNTVSGDEKMTALHRASKDGQTAAARVLMVVGADASLLDFRNRSVLHNAVEGGHLQFAENALLAGADHNTKDDDDDSPLHLAAVHDDEKLVCVLLRRGADADVANSKGHHALHLAVKHDRILVAEALLKAGANPNARYGDKNRCSPLQLARSSLTMTKTLLNHGAEASSSDEMGYTALHWATYSGETGVIDALISAGANLESQGTYIRFHRKYSFMGLTPLHFAAFWRKDGCLVALLRLGATVNSEDVKGLTPLHVVCSNSSAQAGSTEAADLVLRWGADETATHNDGKTP